MRIKTIVSGLLGLALANAKLVMVIRHGEKIDDDHTDLSPEGQARAECLIDVFGTNGPYTTPQKIYAQCPTELRKSTRPRDTVIPLAQSLGLEVDLTYTSGKVKKLANYIKTSPEEVILVAWGNDKIPMIAQEFGIPNVPEWTKKCFDDVWVISDGKTPYRKDGTNVAAGMFSLTIDKERVEQCMSQKLGTATTATNNVNGNVNNNLNTNTTVTVNSENGTSGSIQLKTSVIMTIFSTLLYALVYLY